MALRALHLSVQSGQGIAGFAVIELADIDLLPVDKVVTRLAGRTEPPFMKVFVARNAGRGQPKIRAVQVLILNGCAFLRRDVCGAMALVAVESRVLAFEHIPGFVVVERLSVPLNQGKVFAVVLGVAFCALLAGASRDVIGGVQPALGGKTTGDFGMAFQALERRLSSKLVAAGTVCGSTQRLVRPRQWAGRNLGCAESREEKQTEQQERDSKGDLPGVRQLQRPRSQGQMSNQSYCRSKGHHTPLELSFLMMMRCIEV